MIHECHCIIFTTIRALRFQRQTCSHFLLRGNVRNKYVDGPLKLPPSPGPALPNGLSPSRVPREPWCHQGKIVPPSLCPASRTLQGAEVVEEAAFSLRALSAAGPGQPSPHCTGVPPAAAAGPGEAARPRCSPSQLEKAGEG